MSLSGVWGQCDVARRIILLPATRSCQQSCASRELTFVQPSTGRCGGGTRQHVRDARRNASRLGAVESMHSSCHNMTARPFLTAQSMMFSTVARSEQACAATPNDPSSSSPEAFFNPQSGDIDHQGLRATPPQVDDAAKQRDAGSVGGLSASQSEKTRSSGTTAAQPDRAHFRPGEVLKQSSKRSVRRRNVKEVVIDVAGEAIPDGSSGRGSTSSLGTRSSDISPGDPMEEGWVADTHNDVRAQHWMSESSSSTPLSWSSSLFMSGSAGSLPSGGRVDQDSRSDWGGRPSRISGGGGGGGGNGPRRYTAEGDGSGGAAASATVIVYTFLVAVLLFFWTNIYIVVSRPEKIGTLGKKIAKFMSSATWRVKQLQRQKSVACAAPLKTRYRTLTVYKSGYSRLARRLISPAPAVDVETAEGSHIDRDSAYTSMFLEVPRPQVFAHPVSLRRKSATRRSAEWPSASQWLPVLETTSSGMSMPSARYSPSMLARIRGSTPFNDDTFSGVLVPIPGLRRASGALGSVVVNESGGIADEEACVASPSPDRLGSMESGFSSLPLDSPWAQQTPMVQRHATWTGCLDAGTWAASEHRSCGRTMTGCLDTTDTEDSQISSHEFRDLQKHFVSNLLPGSLTRVSLQRHSASARQDALPNTPPAVQRTKSQPIESEEQQYVKQQAAVRKSASLHSIRDVLLPPSSSNKGERLDAHRLTGDLAELS